MSYFLAILTHSRMLSETIEHYLVCALGDTISISCMGSYSDKVLSGTVYRSIDLYVYGLFERDDIGHRAVGLRTAVLRNRDGRRVLVVSGCAISDRLGCDWYWDLAAKESLAERVERLLTMPPAPAGAFDPVVSAFQRYYRQAVDHHRRS